MEHSKYVVFKIATEFYGIDIMHVYSIEKNIPIMPVPKTRENVEGLINLRGEIIPIFNLRKKLKRISDGDNYLILINRNDKKVALIVDKVTEILEIPDRYTEYTPEIVKNIDTRYISMISNINNRMIVILDIEGVLSAEEEEHLDEARSSLE